MPLPLPLADRHPLPRIIQGGMGVSVSDWNLARSVSLSGELGVVSGTAMEVVVARRLQDGDPGGHVRRALAAFPYPALSRQVMKTYYIHGGKASDAAYRTVPRFTVTPSQELAALTVVGSFVEVWLAKEGHSGPVGINFLRKIEMPLPFGLLGAILADVDYVLVGAGNPRDIPEQIRVLSRGDDLTFEVRAQGMTSADPPVTILCSPTAILGEKMAPRREARFLAIVASVELAAGLAESPDSRPFGFVVEGPTAGGHNAPPRGPRRTDALGQPIYEERDNADLVGIAAVGLPFWLAGSYGSASGLSAALSHGAQGVQVGTAFAYCQESGMVDDHKHIVIKLALEGGLDIRTDWRVSPTGFPFKVVQVEGTISDPAIAEARKAVCDLGALRVPYKKAEGVLDYRCPAEPEAVYVGRKGGRAANIEGRRCLCNALLSAAGMPQRRKNGYVEPPIITSGDDFSTVIALMRGRTDGSLYSATDVINLLRTGIAAAA